jgi:hypothetical protein
LDITEILDDIFTFVRTEKPLPRYNEANMDKGLPTETEHNTEFELDNLNTSRKLIADAT